MKCKITKQSAADELMQKRLGMCSNDNELGALPGSYVLYRARPPTFDDPGLHLEPALRQQTSLTFKHTLRAIGIIGTYKIERRKKSDALNKGYAAYPELL